MTAFKVFLLSLFFPFLFFKKFNVSVYFDCTGSSVLGLGFSLVVVHRLLTVMVSLAEHGLWVQGFRSCVRGL